MSNTSTNGQALPETFEKFLEVTDVDECERCEEVVQRRFLVDGICVGCHHGPAASGGEIDV